MHRKSCFNLIDRRQKLPVFWHFFRHHHIYPRRLYAAVGVHSTNEKQSLAECPAQKWITADELFRLLKALARDFEVTHDAWKLYIGEQQYGSLGYDNSCSWEMLQGRFTLAFLFEYAATLGLLDVAYLVPEGVRNDYSSSWGTDDLSCLSRYDGLIYFRINALGAWCLGLEKNYEPAAVPREPLLKVLPNRDVVATDRPLTPADALFLERFAERKSEAVWRLDAGKILESVGKWLTIEELKMFIEAKGQGPLRQTISNHGQRPGY
jgi:hypothetical protein